MEHSYYHFKTAIHFPKEPATLLDEFLLKANYRKIYVKGKIGGLTYIHESENLTHPYVDETMVPYVVKQTEELLPCLNEIKEGKGEISFVVASHEYDSDPGLALGVKPEVGKCLVALGANLDFDRYHY